MKFPARPQSSCVAVFRRAAHFQIAVVSMLLPGLTIWTSPVMANPQGGSVVHGDVNIGAGAGGNLQIRQNSRNAIINWEQFSIQAGELTQFRQPNSNSSVLNRVTGGDPSAIHGALRANGNVFVINPNGILVGPGGTIDVHGLVLSTLDVSNGEFLAEGDMTFAGAGEGVTNLGRINAIGGDVFLIGRTVTNSGSISATGTVGLAAGEEVLLTAGESASGERIFVRAKGSGVSGTGIFNDGTIEGAAVELKAHGNIYALAINNKGSIRATGATTSGGRVFLRGAGGTVQNSGSIRATSSGAGSGGRVLIEAAYAKVDGMIRAQGGQVNIAATNRAEVGAGIDATNSGGRGGDVVIEGSEIALGNGSKIDASGATGGGNVRIGGGFQGRDATVRNADTLTVEAGAVVRADALVNGAGGNVILWADNDTLFNGEVTARGFSRGGFAEISGKGSLNFDGMVDLTAENGPAGTLLLDPTNVTISAAVASSNNINNVALSTLLDQGTNVIISTNFGGAEAGNITVNDRVEWYQQNAATTPGALTLLAMGNVQFNRSVRSAGTGGINVVAGWNGTTGILDPIGAGAQTTPGAFNMAAVLATMPGGSSAASADAAGLGGGSVFVNSAAGVQNVEVGSRFGATMIAAHDLILASGTGADDRWAQVGFHDSGYEYELGRTYNGSRNEWWGNAAGNVRAKNYIADLGGTAFNGGAFRGAGYGATGAISVGLSGRLDMRGANSRNRSYVQIGHGGTVEGEAVRGATAPLPAVNTTRDGFVLDPDNDNNRPYFSATWRTNYLGHAARINAPVSVTASEDILVSAARAFETTAGYTDMVVAEQGSGSYAQIGHGGYRQAASLHGDVSVVAHGATTALDARGLAGTGIQLRGSNGSGSYAQIGHGSAGGFNRRSIWDQQMSGNVTVTATTGAVRAIGFNQLPRAGTSLLERNTGAILGQTTPTPNNSAVDAETLYSHVQIGHGASSESAPTTGGGFTAPNIVNVPALFDPFNNTFVNPGTVINNRTPEMSMSGNISVFAGGTVQVRDNMGYDSVGNWTSDPGPGTEPYLQSGGILRNIGIEVRAGNNHSSYGMIGHGGTQISALDPLSTGHVGNINVNADKGGLLFVGGEEKRSQRSWGFGQNFVQIGHGGQTVQGPKQGNITVSAGQGLGALDGDVIFRSGRMRQSFAQIGHGGQDVTRAITGDGLSDISVVAKGNVEFTSRISGPSDVRLSNDYVDWAMGETGSGSAGNAEVAERVVGTLASGTESPQSAFQGHNWDTNVKYVMIGHGGNNVNFTGNFSLNNEITVAAQTGSFRMTAGGGDRDFAQIGHGGYRSGGAPSVVGGNLTLGADGDIIIDASNPGTIMVERSSMVGIVQRDGLGNFLSLGQEQALGRGFASYGMIGNGGYDMDGDHSGSLTVTAGGNLHLIGPNAPQAGNVVGYTAGFVEGASNNPASGVQNYWIGNRHTQDTLVEASMMQRSFQLYHGNGGASQIAHKGNIVPGTLLVDLSGTGGTDLRDAPNGDGVTGTIYRAGAAVGGNYAVGTHGVAHGTIDYTTGKVTLNTSLVTANNGELENDRNAINRPINYSYANPTLAANVAIANERTPESDTALRPNEAFLGHGRINPTTVRLVIDGDNNGGGTKVFTDPLGNGELRNNLHQVVGNIDYDTGRVRFRNNLNPTGDEVSADYTWVTGASDSAFVQLGNGGLGSSTGGRNSAGHTGQIQVTAGGDIRLHGGAHANAYAQLGHGGEGSPSRMGAQTDGANLNVDQSGNITVNAGGIVEVLAGRGFTFFDSAQYGMLGHGGRDTDGHHQGNIVVNSGIGAMSLAPGVIGGGAQAGLVFTSGQTANAFSQLGHGGSDSQSAREDGDTGRRGFTGNITTNATGDIRFTAGTGAFSTVSVLGASTGWEDTRNYTQLGHGGLSAGTRHDNGLGTIPVFGTGVGHNGDITVSSSAGSISFQAGDTAFGSAGANYGILHFALLGHGGYDANGEHSGNISVTANQSITFRSGAALLDDNASKHSFAQLGHGADSSDGNMGIRNTGGGQINTLNVTATNGDIGFYAGPGLRNYAQLGFGGINSRGDHRAAITVNAGGNLNFIGGNAPAQQVSDVSSELDIATSQLGWVATRNRNLTTTNVLVTTDFGTFTANTSTGVLVVATLTAAGTTAGLTVGQSVGQVNYMNGHVRFTSAISGGTIPVQFNNNGGAVEDNDPSSVLPSIANLVNSRNTLLDAAAMNPGAFSAPNLIATFNNTRGGLTNVVEAIGARDLNVGIASGTFSMTIPTNGTSTLLSDNGAGGLVVSQVGTGSGLTMGATVGSIDYTDGSIRLNTVVNPGRFSGVTANYTLDRVVGPDVTYVQLGNGGYDADNPNGGAAPAGAAFSPGMEGNISAVAGGSIRFHGGNGQGAYAQMGNGGAFTHGSHGGTITVNSGGIVEFLAGLGADLTDGQTYAQLGHGGHDADGNHSGTITVTAKSGLVSTAPGNLAPGTISEGIRFRGGRTDQAFVQLGHGGYGSRSGNGDGIANARGLTGNISVISDGSIGFTSGTLREDIFTNNDGANYAQLGHGGYDADVTANAVDVTGTGIGHNGDIFVQSKLGSVNFLGGGLFNGSEGTGMGRFHYTQLGHGGYSANGDHFGNITVLAGVNVGGAVNNATADIRFTGGGTSDNDASKINYAQIGHGGRDSLGNMGRSSETITVSAARDITFTAGIDQESYAQLGNGGMGARGDHKANIVISGGRDIAFKGNIGALTIVDEFTTDFHQATNLGVTTLGAGEGDAVTALEGTNLEFNTLLVSIPRGPTLIDVPTAANAGNIVVRDTVTVDMDGNGVPETTFTAGQIVGTLVYTTSTLTFTTDVNPDNRPITVAPSTPLVSARATYQSRENTTSYAQLGHGGYDADNPNPGDNAASILMPDGNTYLFDGYGVGGPTAAQRVGNSGNITVTSENGNLTFLSGESGNSYAQLGHGGMVNDGDHIGNILLRIDADASAGQGNVLFDARGFDVTGTHNVQLGHGGFFSSGGHVGSIDLIAGGKMDFLAGRDSSYAQVGHGGRNDHRLNIARVTATGADDLDTDGNYNTAGVSNQTPPDDRRDFANDRYYSGTHTGDILIRTRGNIAFTAYSQAVLNNGGVGYAQIGHGGFRNAADPTSINGQGHNGAIQVEAGFLTINGGGQVTAAANPSATITFEAGMQSLSNVQIGHGGFEAFGNHFGDIRVAAAAGVDFHAKGATTDLAFTDANGNRSGRYSYLQIGHGGINSDYDPYLPRALETRNTGNPGADVALSAANGNVFNENPATNLFYANAVSAFNGYTWPTGGASTAVGQGSLMPLTTFFQPIVSASTVRFVDHDNNGATAMVPIVPTNRGQWFHINAPAAPVDGSGNPITGNSGNVSVVSLAGDVSLTSVPDTSRYGREQYVQVGHGGIYSGGDHAGNLSVIAQGGNVVLRGGLANVNDGGYNSYAQIGHGGTFSGGTMSGNITVRALGAGSKVNARAGSDNQNYVQLGHGGYDASFLYGAGTQLSTFDANGVTLGDTRAVAAQGFNLQYWYNPGFIARTEYTSLFGNNALVHNDGIAFRRTITGDVVVEGADGVALTGTTTGGIAGNIGPSAYAQIGHGGRSTESDNTGDITLSGGTGSVLVKAGLSDQAYAQVGHGGYFGRGNQTGNLTINGGQDSNGAGLDVRAGNRPDAYAQIGHGGNQAKSAARDSGNPTVPLFKGNSGNISVLVGGAITFVAGTGDFVNSDEDSRNYVQLGHGGYEADVHHAATVDLFDTGIGHNGDISVISSAGRIFFGAGDAGRSDEASLGLGEGRFHYAQLGHGGYEARGEHFGDITVSAAGAGRDVVFLGGSSEDNDADRVNYAHLGHGGWTARGNLGRAGELISVTAGRDIVFRAGNSQGSPVQLGNGGRESRGDHKGDILVRAGRDIEFAGVQGRHLISGEEKNFDLTRATEFGTQTSDAIYDLEGSNVVPGTIVIQIPNGPTLGDNGQGGIIVTGGDPLVLAGLSLTIGEVVGSVAYTGGTVANGRITFTKDVNPNNAASPGAALLANVSYESLEIQGSYAQLGHGGYNADNADGGFNSLGNVGNISLFAGGDVAFNAGVGAQGYSQLGHGGYLTDGRNSGNISLGSASERIGGAVILTGGRGEFFDAVDAYAQVGHGGRSARGTQVGDISIHASSGVNPAYTGIGVQLKSGTRENNYTLIGHGGTGSRSGTGNGVAGMEGNSGSILVDALGDINVIAGVLNIGGSTVAQSVNDGNLFAQIGHGGYDADVSIDQDIGASGGAGYTNGIGHNGAITVISRLGSVNVLGGDHLRTLLPSFAPTAGVYDGIVHNGITRSDSFAGGRFHYGMIGHGGYEARGNHWGDITVHAGFDNQATQTGTLADSHVRVIGGRAVSDNDDSQQYAQIGHGGRSSLGQQGRTTDVTSVMASGNVEVQGGPGTDSYAQIGNGGTNARGDHRGNIQIFAGGNVSVLAGQYSRTQTLADALYSRYYHVSTANAGELNQNTDRAGLLQAVAGGNAAGVLSFRPVNGVLPGSVKVEVYNDAGLRIGTIADDGTGALRVVSNFTELVGGAQLSAGDQVGTVNYAGNNLTFTTRVNPGVEGGSANVIVSMSHVRTDRAYAQIGHGGYDADDPNNDTTLGASGNISVVAMGNIEGRGGESLNNYVQIGHGGYETKGAASGNIHLRSGGDVNFTARGVQDRAYVQVGHGGWDADGNHSGNVVVSAGSGALGTHLGTGLFDDLGDFDRNGIADQIQFAAPGAGQGSVTLTGGTFTDSWVQIGHGGRSSGNTAGNASTMTGKVGVAANGGITLQGGTAARGFTQIGHGGWEDGTLNMTLAGDISVISQTGLIRALGGTGSEAYSLIGHGSLRNAAASVPLGTRSGSIYIEAANWEITPNGVNSLARFGHRSQAANNGLTAGNQFSLVGNGANGTTSYLVNSAALTLMGANDHLAAGGGATFAAIGDLVMDLPLTYNSASDVNMLATGDLTILRGVQNGGTGDVNAVAGWNSLSPDLDFLDKVPMRLIDIGAIYADPTAWGNNGGVASIGGGSQLFGVAVGSARGETTILGDTVDVKGSTSAAGGYAVVGYAPTPGVSPTGSILVASNTVDVSVEGGALTNTFAQIGHRALGSIVPNLSGPISVVSGGDLLVRGGSALQTSAHIGHGGIGATTTSIGGDILVDVANDTNLFGGSGSASYAQIGHGGLSTSGAMSGLVSLESGGNIQVVTANLTNLSYAKIGHGDDLRGASAAQGGLGVRTGNVLVSAGEDITIQTGMIGHVNNVSPATSTSGSTQIGVARSNPADPAAGTLTANNQSQFQGGDDVRFYVPRRENNRVAAGARINGVSFVGGLSDPWPTQREDEFTNYLSTDAGLLQPAEHDNTLGSGGAPTNVGNFAFYYDLIVSGPPVIVPNPGGGGTGGSGGGGNNPGGGGNDPGTGGPTPPAQPDPRKGVLDDRIVDDWIREQEGEYSGPGSTGIYYEGFSQYGPNGESVFDLDLFGGSETGDEEDVLRRQLEFLEQQAAQNGSASGESE